MFRAFARRVRRDGLRSASRAVLSFLFEDPPLAGHLVERYGRPLTVDGVVLDFAREDVDVKIKNLLVLGSYESAERAQIREYLTDSATVIELGGGIGFVSCFVDRVTDPEKHVVVEANPAVLPVLERHRELNGAGFSIVERAYAKSDDPVEFYVHEDSAFTGSSRHRPSDATESVPTVSLGDLVAENDIDRCDLVVDIEGSELELVREELETLQSHCRFLFVEFHYPLGDITSSDVDEAKETLRTAGFRLVDERESGRNCVYRNTAF